MIDLKIGGVPEHFNLPWYFTLRDKEYHDFNINLRWEDFHGGTGQMTKALRDGSIDMAVVLTEGIVWDIINGNPSKIVQVYVDSPLIWGVHVADGSRYKSNEDLKGKKAAISRFGSGSHLMAYVNAERNNWEFDTDLKFEVVGNLQGALEQLPSGGADYFMWEKFTTKPYVDQGVFRLIDECPTPWPCFVIAVREKLLNDDPKRVKHILEVINNTTRDFKNIPSIDRTIANRYDQKIDDVQQWLSLTSWSESNLTSEELTTVQNKLLQLNLIETEMDSGTILHTF